MTLTLAAKTRSDAIDRWKNSQDPDITPWVAVGGSLAGRYRPSGPIVAISGPHLTASGEEGWHITIDETHYCEVVAFCRHLGVVLSHLLPVRSFAAEIPKVSFWGTGTRPRFPSDGSSILITLVK